jgi:ammonia channel protein AmtB
MPAWILCWILKKLDLLRVPKNIELAGLDYVENSIVEEQFGVIIEAERNAAKS